MRYLTGFGTRKTPQSQPIPGSRQVRNSAGGYAWAIDDWTRLDRFLVLGTEGGTYYVAEQALTADNARAVLRCLRADGPRAVRRIVELSESGRAPKNDPALFALAMAASLGDLETRRTALAALPRVARTGTHLLHFAAFAEQFRGWGRGLRQAVARWYLERPVEQLAYQVVKYQQRDGWSHRDLLRLAHPAAPDDPVRQAVLRYAVKGELSEAAEPTPPLAYLAAAEQALRTSEVAELVGLIRDYGLTREMVNSQLLASPEVWAALLERMPLTALIRNLATMTRVGLLAPLSEATREVVSRLDDRQRLAAARIHPIAVLAALLTYAAGHGARGRGTWQPVPEIVDALDRAFYASFEQVTPTGQRLLLALDVSGSMDAGRIAGVPGLTPRLASAAMALVTAAVEPQRTMLGFSHELVELRISPRQRLDDVASRLRAIPMGGTDCALPMIWAQQRRQEVDAFIVYTDSETWFGKVHPAQALRAYRERLDIPARLIVVGMTASRFSIADPDDAGMLDVVGFDSAVPELIGQFLRADDQPIA